MGKIPNIFWQHMFDIKTLCIYAFDITIQYIAQNVVGCNDSKCCTYVPWYVYMMLLVVYVY